MRGEERCHLIGRFCPASRRLGTIGLAEPCFSTVKCRDLVELDGIKRWAGKLLAKFYGKPVNKVL